MGATKHVDVTTRNGLAWRKLALENGPAGLLPNANVFQRLQNLLQSVVIFPQILLDIGNLIIDVTDIFFNLRDLVAQLFDLLLDFLDVVFDLGNALLMICKHLVDRFEVLLDH